MDDNGRKLRRRRAFGDLVRERRTALGLSQHELAERAGTDEWVIREIGQGERDTVPKKSAQDPAFERFADALGWDRSQLAQAIRGRIHLLEGRG